MDQASAWLAGLDAGTADPEEFAAWREGNPLHAVAFAQVVDAYQQIGQLKVLHHRGVTPSDEAPNARPATEAVSRRKLLHAGLAAGGVAAAGGFMSVRAYGRQWAETGIGEMRSLALSDGSRVFLNTGTKMGWRLSDGRCLLWLERGEMRIEAHPQQRGALCVMEGDSRILLDRGIFNLRREKEKLDLLVLEGSALWQKDQNAQNTALPSGQEASIMAGDLLRKPAPPMAMARAQIWKEGQLVFEGEDLSFVLGEYNRYLLHPLQLADPALGKIHFGGRFTSTDPADLLIALHASFGIAAVNLPDGTILLERT